MIIGHLKYLFFYESKSEFKLYTVNMVAVSLHKEFNWNNKC